ncbi:hypothetical protein AGDE_15178 [Angomonas deanei]|nr:hypothetical protein AGDE_15178 [Angomonas deanei]|eukprot:EPY19569.1 hypothetical protein AGDE_15178 [Angomonas deanei]
MIATVSPSEVNYDETLSTLRYASRARDIVNVAQVNEDPRARRIRELEEQMNEMRKNLGGGSVDNAYVKDLEEKLALMQSEAQNARRICRRSRRNDKRTKLESKC